MPRDRPTAAVVAARQHGGVAARRDWLRCSLSLDAYFRCLVYRLLYSFRAPTWVLIPARGSNKNSAADLLDIYAGIAAAALGLP